MPARRLCIPVLTSSPGDSEWITAGRELPFWASAGILGGRASGSGGQARQAGKRPGEQNRMAFRLLDRHFARTWVEMDELAPTAVCREDRHEA